MSLYEEQLEDKIKRQKEEITRLLTENAKLKEENFNLSLYSEGCKCACEQARAEGQEEAWKLALKLRYMDYEDKVECFGLGYDGKEKWVEIIEKYTYTEAAAKVAEWKKAKEEICVGDVLLSNETGNKCIVTRISNEVVTTLWNDGSCGDKTKDFVRGRFKKIGHIDVNTWLAQIGGESE